eukprot:GHVH01011146.1.p1 GENE.GHVH01011146.1~~GHVH01011146.1.p1  ORF type:complete len:184 (+),score=35.58 GHVH01011146.1:48-554(+)
MAKTVRKRPAGAKNANHRGKLGPARFVPGKDGKKVLKTMSKPNSGTTGKERSIGKGLRFCPKAGKIVAFMKFNSKKISVKFGVQLKQIEGTCGCPRFKKSLKMAKAWRAAMEAQRQQKAFEKSDHDAIRELARQTKESVESTVAEDCESSESGPDEKSVSLSFEDSDE